MNRIIISRVDKIGDVILTLPLAGYLKKKFPGCFIIFLGRKYTKPIIEACSNIDEFVDWENVKELSFFKRIKAFKKLKADTIIHVYPNAKIARNAWFAKIPSRIGTSRRWYHWLFVNKQITLSRKKSDLHEAQLNIALISKWVNDYSTVPFSEISCLYGFSRFEKLNDELASIIHKDKFNLILHPKSKGSAREWGLDKYAELLRELPPDRFQIIVTGTEEEAREMEQLLKVYKNRIVDLTGKLSLSEYVSVIAAADGIVACSTGPLHIAAAAGKYALGLYAPMKPIYPQRWAPIGPKASFLVKEGECNICRRLNYCECISSITSKEVIGKLEQFYHEKFCLHRT